MTDHEKFKKALNYFLGAGIITMDDVLSSAGEKELIMLKALNQLHPYEVFQASGYWMTYIPDPTRPEKRKRIKRKNKQDLENFLFEYYAKENITFASLYAEFMEYKEALVANTTIYEYIKSYNKYYKGDEITERDLKTLTVPDIEKWLAGKVQEAGGMNTKQFRKMACVFSELMKYAFQKRYINENPFARIDYRQLGVTKRQRKTSKTEVFNISEISAILERAEADLIRKPNNPAPLGIILAFQTGLRAGELVALKWSDIDLEKRTMKVQRFERRIQAVEDDYTRSGKQEFVIVEGTKGRYGPRTVTLADETLETLSRLEEFYKRAGFSSEWLLATKSGKLRYKMINRRLERYCREAGIPERSSHKIRKTFISALRDGGMSFEKIAEIVGHKQISTTMSAYSYDLKPDAENLEIMNSALSFSGHQRAPENS